MIAMRGKRCCPGFKHKAKLMAFDRTDLPEPGRAYTKSIHVVCKEEPGWKGQGLPSGERNSKAPCVQGEAGRVIGNM